MTETNKLAERIARLLEAESQPNELASVFATLEKINHRLDRLEAAAATPQQTPTNVSHHHPSAERFDIVEALADKVFEGIQQEKACTFEPNGRPCDHCSMCSARGF